MTKFCKNCKHYRWAGSRCLASPVQDPVTGEDDFFFASIERQSVLPGRCGPDGANFEANVIPQGTFDKEPS